MRPLVHHWDAEVTFDFLTRVEANAVVPEEQPNSFINRRQLQPHLVRLGVNESII